MGLKLYEEQDAINLADSIRNRLSTVNIQNNTPVQIYYNRTNDSPNSYGGGFTNIKGECRIKYTALSNSTTGSSRDHGVACPISNYDYRNRVKFINDHVYLIYITTMRDYNNDYIDCGVIVYDGDPPSQYMWTTTKHIKFKYVEGLNVNFVVGTYKPRLSKSDLICYLQIIDLTAMDLEEISYEEFRLLYPKPVYNATFYTVDEMPQAINNIVLDKQLKIHDARWMYQFNDNQFNLMLSLLENVTSFQYMPYSWEAMSTSIVDWTNVNVQNLQHAIDNGITDSTVDMSYAFSNMNYIGTLYFNNVSPKNITTMTSMFENSHIGDVDMSTWNLSNVTNMSRMFTNSKDPQVEFEQQITISLGNSETVWNNNLITNGIFDFTDWHWFNQHSLYIYIRGKNVMPLTASIDINTWDSSFREDMLKFYVPASLYAAYQRATNWSAMAKYIYPIPE